MYCLEPWSPRLDADLPPLATLRRAIERLSNGTPHLSLAERRKRACLTMNLRIIEDLHGSETGVEKATSWRGRSTWRADGGRANHPRYEGDDVLPSAG